LCFVFYIFQTFLTEVWIYDASLWRCWRILIILEKCDIISASVAPDFSYLTYTTISNVTHNNKQVIPTPPDVSSSLSIPSSPVDPVFSSVKTPFASSPSSSSSLSYVEYYETVIVDLYSISYTSDRYVIYTGLNYAQAYVYYCINCIILNNIYFI
jgi:hypothetical protein